MLIYYFVKFDNARHSHLKGIQMKKITVFSGLFILFFSCKNPEITDPDAKVFSQIKKAEWLLGTWDNNDSQSDYYEIWTRVNDSTFSAKTFLAIERDTIFADSMSISERNGSLFFSKSTPYQNRRSFIDFGLTSSADGRLIFENPKNEFPNRIIYQKISRDSISISNTGIRNSEDFSQQYGFRKNVTKN